jgi:hypothetical protein
MKRYRGVYRVETTRLPDWDTTSPAWYSPAITFIHIHRILIIGGL